MGSNCGTQSSEAAVRVASTDDRKMKLVKGLEHMGPYRIYSTTA